MPIDKEKIEQLRDEISRRIWVLHGCNARFENSLDDEAKAILNPGGLANKNLTQQEVEHVGHLDVSIGNAFRYSMFVGVCTLHVELLAIYCDFFLDDYASAIKGEKQGSDIERHLALLRKRFGIMLDEPLCRILDDLRIVRNCIIHDWGKCVQTRRAQETIEAVARINNSHPNSISDAGTTLLLEDHGAVPLGITTAIELNDALAKALLNT